MTTVGPTAPATISNDTAVGTLAWSNPTNAGSSNNVYATASRYRSSTPNNVTTNYLKGLNPGFSVPSGATIDGIAIAIERKCNFNSSDNNMKDATVKLVKGGTVVGNNKADTSTAWPTSDTSKTYGSSTDLWGTTWTYSDVNGSTFGLVLSGTHRCGWDETCTASVDLVTITVYYTVGGTTYYQTASGTFTPAASAKKLNAQSKRTGAITSAGSAKKSSIKYKRTGALTPAALVKKLSIKYKRTGSVTPSAAVKKLVMLYKRTGAIASAGSLKKTDAQFRRTGSITPAATIRKLNVQSKRTGAFTPAGSLRKLDTQSKRTGTIAPSGSKRLAVAPAAFDGGIGVSGAAHLLTYKPLSGVVEYSGALLKTAQQYLEGVLSSLGELDIERMIGRLLSGSIDIAGSFIKHIDRTLFARMTSSSAGADVVAVIDHETGDLSQYTTVYDPDNDMTVSALAALDGSYGLACNIADTNPMFAQKDLGALVVDVARVRVYVKLSDLTMADYEKMVLLSLSTSDGGSISDLVVRRVLGSFTVAGRYLDDNGSVHYTSYLPLDSNGSYIEMETCKGEFDAEIRLWVNGSYYADCRSVGNGTRFANLGSVAVGAGITYSLEEGTTGTLYIDDVVVNTDGSEIGPITPLVGILIKETSTFFDAALSSAGALLTSAGKLLIGIVDSASNIVRSISFNMASGLSTVGDLLAHSFWQFEQNISGVFNAAGSLFKRSFTKRSGSVGSQGHLDWLPLKKLTGILASSSAIDWAQSKFVSGIVLPIGSVVKHTTWSVVALLGTSGRITRKISRNISALMTPQGWLGVASSMRKALVGVLSSTSSLVKTVNKRFRGTVTTAGAFDWLPMKKLTAVIAPSGTTFKKVFDTLLAELSTASTLVAEMFEAIYYKVIGGMIESVGVTKKATSRLLSSAVGFASSISRKALKIHVSIVAFNGNLLRLTKKGIGGSLNSLGRVFKRILAAVEGQIEPESSITKWTPKTLAGTLQTEGLLQAIKAFMAVVAGALATSGTVKRVTKRMFIGAIRGTGNLLRDIFTSLAGIVTLDGMLLGLKTLMVLLTGLVTTTASLSAKALKRFSNTLSSVGSVTKMSPRTLTGVVTFFVGKATKRLTRFVAGSVTLSSNITRRAVITVEGTVDFASGIIRRVSKQLSSVLSLAGVAGRIATLFRSLTGSVSSAGLLHKRAATSFSGSLSLSGVIRKGWAQLVTGVLSSVGVVSTIVTAIERSTIQLTLWARSRILSLKSRSRRLTLDDKD